MNSPLRMLLVEDSEDDELLLLAALRADGLQISHKRVYSAEALRRALADGEWDVVISDYYMPDFDARSALSIVKSVGVDLPFIIVSGTVGEEQAVEAMRAGAHDYVMKRALSTVAAKVRREVEDARERQRARELQLSAVDAMRERERVEAVQLARSSLLANVSQELRTPLSKLIGFAELLESEQAGPLTPQQAEYLHYILNSGRHLLSVVGDIFDLSRVEIGRMALTKQPTALGPIAHQVRDTLQPLATKQGVMVSLAIEPGMPPLDADPLRVRQILYNLLSNAIKFTPSGGRIALSARSLGTVLELAVSDTGVGIQRADLPRLFRESEPLTSEDRASGSGLGLALTKRMVELHGGTIVVHSEQGVGTRFTIHLPVDLQTKHVAEGRGVAGM